MKIKVYTLLYYFKINTASNKINKELGWQPQETFETGIRKTIEWFINNQDWVKHVQSGEYKTWVDKNYTNR